MLKDKVQQYGDREFFRYLGKSFSYEDLERESNKVAKGLQSQGIKKGDKVAIVMKNRPEFLFIWFGLCKLGAIEVPINTAHRGSILTYMIDHADCRFLIVEAPFLDRVTPVLKDLPTVEKVVVLSDTDEPLPTLDKPALDYSHLVENDGSLQRGGSDLVRSLYYYVYFRYHRSLQRFSYAPQLCPLYGGTHLYGDRL